MITKMKKFKSSLECKRSMDKFILFSSFTQKPQISVPTSTPFQLILYIPERKASECIIQTSQKKTTSEILISNATK